MERIKLMMAADLHFEEKYLHITAPAWKRACQWAVENRVDQMLIAGDVFTDYNVAGRTASFGTIWAAFAQPLKRSDIKAIIVPGNHDIAGAGQRDALTPFDSLIGEVLVARECGMVGTRVLDNTVGVACLPWLTKAAMLGLKEYAAMSPEEADVAFMRNVELAIGHLRRETAAWHEKGLPVVLLGHVTVHGSTTAKGFGLGGGSFCVTNELLESVGADIIAIGDVHKRQGHYIGSLVQNGYGEEGNPTGFRVVTLEGRNVVEDIFVDLPTPRFWTVTPETYPPKDAKPGDYIKVRGTVQPSGELPENVVFQRVPEPPAVRQRTDDVLTSDTPLQTLLAVWHKATNCLVGLERLQEGLLNLMHDVTLPDEAIGSMTSLDRLHLLNIGSHADTTVDLSGVKGLIGLVGDNGAGKTFLLESPMAAAYGRYPYRPGALRDSMRSGSTEAMIECEFTRGKERFKLLRHMKRSDSGKTYKSTAYVHKWSSLSGKWDAAAGPNVEDADARATALIGDEALVLASVFCSQNQAGDLADADPADRKELFAKLLGTAKLAALYEAAREACKSVEAEVKAIEGRIASLDLECGALPEAEEAVRRVDADIADTDLKITAATAECVPLREDVARVSSQQGERARLEMRLNSLREDARRLEANRLSLEGTCSRHRKAIERKAEYEKARDELAALEGQQKVIQEANAAVAIARDAKQQAIANNRKRLAELERSIANALAGERITLQSKAEADDLQASAAVRRYTDELHTADKALVSAKSALADARRRAALLAGGTYTAELCKTCPFTADAFAAEKSIPDLEAALQTAQKAHDAALTSSHKTDAETLKAYAEGLRKQARELVQADVAPAEVAEGARLCEETARLEEELNSLTVKPVDQTVLYHMNALRESAAMLATLPERERELAQSRTDLDALMARVFESDAAIQQAANELAQSQNPEAELTRLRAEIATRESNIRVLQARRNGLSETRGQRLARVQTLRASVERLNKANTDADLLRAKGEVVMALASAFSRDGIPQLVVSSAIPQFQDILTDLLREFDGRWAVSLSTQSVTRKGVVKEALDILVDDGNGTRDILSYSGGERKLLKTLIRIGFAVLQAQRSGERLQVFFFDEAFDALDAENSRRILAVFRTLSRWFNQVFVVSHSDALLSSLPTRISLTASPNGTVAQLVRW